MSSAAERNLTHSGFSDEAQRLPIQDRFKTANAFMNRLAEVIGTVNGIPEDFFTQINIKKAGRIRDRIFPHRIDRIFNNTVNAESNHKYFRFIHEGEVWSVEYAHVALGEQDDISGNHSHRYHRTMTLRTAGKSITLQSVSHPGIDASEEGNWPITGMLEFSTNSPENNGEKNSQQTVSEIQNILDAFVTSPPQAIM